jgi:hypothetical protein
MRDSGSEATLKKDEALRILSKPARRIVKMVYEREEKAGADSSVLHHTIASLSRDYRHCSRYSKGIGVRRKRGVSYSFIWRHVKPLSKAGFLALPSLDYRNVPDKGSHKHKLARYEIGLGSLLRLERKVAVAKQKRR